MDFYIVIQTMQCSIFFKFNKFNTFLESLNAFVTHILLYKLLKTVMFILIRSKLKLKIKDLNLNYSCFTYRICIFEITKKNKSMPCRC